MLPIRGLSSTLSAVFRPILWALGMATRPAYDELFDGTVRRWYDYVESRCMTDHDVRGRYEDPKSLPVRMIRRYKESSFSEHEYLVAEIAPRGQPYVYLQLERSRLPESTPPSRSDHQADSSRNFTTALASLSSTSISSSPDSLKRGPANDQVNVIQCWPEKGTRAGRTNGSAGGKEKMMMVIEEVTFKNTTLHDLMIVARTLHDSSPDYELFTRQCYWFADLIVRILARCDSTSRRKPVDSTAEAEVSVAEEHRYNPSASSKWSGIPIHEAKQKNLEELTSLYEERKEQFRNKARFDFTTISTVLNDLVD